MLEIRLKMTNDNNNRNKNNNENNIKKFAKNFIKNKAKYNPDFIHIKGKILIKDINYIKENLKYKSFSNTQRVVLIEIDDITIDAQNSMLKILEENNEDTTIIISINNTNRLLDTIKSRCIIEKDESINKNDYYIESFISMNLEERLSFIDNINDTEDFIINVFSYIIENYKEIDNIEEKLKKLNEIQKSLHNNISSKLLLTDLALNI